MFLGHDGCNEMKLNLTSEQKEELRNRIDEFNNWVYCECSDCKGWSGSHAINTDASIEKLIEEVLKDRETDEL